MTDTRETIIDTLPDEDTPERIRVYRSFDSLCIEHQYHTGTGWQVFASISFPASAAPAIIAAIKRAAGEEGEL